MKLFSSIFRQHKANSWWGSFKLIAADVSMFVQLLILAFSLIGAWSSLSLWLSDRGIPAAFWQFALALAVAILFLSLLVWKVAVPSDFNAWNRQWWSNNNPARREIEKQGKSIKAIMKHFGIKDED